MLTLYALTNRLFRPHRGQLYNFSDVPVAWSLVRKTEKISNEIKRLVSQKDDVGSTSLRSYYKDDYQVGLYGQLGAGNNCRELRTDLLFFLSEQKKTTSDYLSFWAVFEDDDFLKIEFDAALLRELLFLNKGTDEATVNVIADSLNAGFRFNFAGAEFYVVGLYAANSRHSRRFSYPTLVFNVLNQYKTNRKLGLYDLTV